MLYRPLIAFLSLLIVAGFGCGSPFDRSTLPPSVQELQKQDVPKHEKQEKTESIAAKEASSASVSLYRGTWFDVEYPSNFTAHPIRPKEKFDTVDYVATDEAYFLSPDQSVEFFVYSPLWSGNPKQYLDTAKNEVVVSEKINEVTGIIGDSVTRYVTVRAEDFSYYRSFVSIKEQVNSGSDIHHVFGIKYRDDAAYEQYKEQYIAFKKSLTQYAD